MLTTIRVLRVLIALVAAWQILGLLPVLTNWLPNLQNVTGGMWAVAFIKTLILLVCGGIYFWLGKIKSRVDNSGTKTSEGRLIVLSLLALVSGGIVLAIFIPVLSDRGARAESIPAHPAQPTVSNSVGVEPQHAKPPTFESEGWTQETTGSTESGPWLSYDPAGTRYYRDANRIIYRVSPPGVKSGGEKANPFGLMDSTDSPPK